MNRSFLVTAAMLMLPATALSQQQPSQPQPPGAAPAQKQMQAPAQRSEAPAPRGEDRTAPATQGENASESVRSILGRLAQSDLKNQISAAAETVSDGCASDIKTFCPGVQPGQGRMLTCMREHVEQL